MSNIHFKFNLGIQGTGVNHASELSLSVMYHSANKNDQYEHILKQVFLLVVKEFSQKAFLYGGFNADIPSDLSMNTIEKESMGNGIKLNDYKFDDNEVKISVTDAGDWCYTDVITKAMKRFFIFNYTELSSIILINTHFAKNYDIIRQQKQSLRNLMTEYKGYTDENNSMIIGARNAAKRQQQELEAKLQEFEQQFED